MAVYRAAPGAGFSHKEAQVVGRALEELGEFSPHQVVEAARPARSSLHKYFEWNDSRAAEAFRVDQARQLVNHIRIVVKVSGEKIETKAFHNVRVRVEDRIENRYEAFRVAVADTAMKEQILAKALQELLGWQTRYAQYQDVFGAVFDAIEAVRPEVERLEQRSRPAQAAATA